MVVQHNLRAMNSNRMLGLTQSQQAKSSEKLSSGYKINRAADDAAGLSISEKMRKQIRGLTQASLNAQDGISAVQTAEGALHEVQDMLQRMNELAVKAANGTNSEDDRSYIQDEIDQLITEIDRVAETTKFNETYLLKGTDSKVIKNIAAQDAGITGKLVDNEDGTSTFRLEEPLEEGSKISIAGREYLIGKTPTDADYILDDDANDLVLQAGDSITVDGKTTTVVNKVDDIALLSDGNGDDLAAGDTFVDADGVAWTISGTAGDPAEITGMSGTVGLDNIADALKAGSVVTKLAGNDTRIEVVENLADGEFSSQADDPANITAEVVNGGVTLEEGDVVTKLGFKKTLTAEPAESFADVSKTIMQLEADNAITVAIQNPEDLATRTYTVSTTTDLSNPLDLKATREDIISFIKEYGQVDVNGAGANTIYGVGETTKEGTITAEEAYRKIAEELTKASSIGADEGAVVTHMGNGEFEIKQATVEVKDFLSFNLHVGADADSTNRITLSMDSMSADALGITGLDVTDETGTLAIYAVDAIAEAIQKISTQRSALGAVQNRLEHTINNLDNVVENTTAAESQIRDTDMATEMVKFSNNNILAQAGQAMLAQSNQANQGVLALLQ